MHLLNPRSSVKRASKISYNREVTGKSLTLVESYLFARLLFCKVSGDSGRSRTRNRKQSKDDSFGHAKSLTLETSCIRQFNITNYMVV